MLYGSNQRVVVLFPGALGDFVLAADALGALRERHRDATITIAVNGWLRGIAAASGVADAHASLDDAAASGLFGGTRVPEWFGSRPHLHAWIGAGDPVLQTGLRGMTSSAAFHRVVRDDGPEHASRVYAAQVGPDSLSAVPWRLPDPTPRVRALSATGAVLVVHRGAGAARKRWAREGFEDVVRRWRGLGGTVADVVGPAEVDDESLPDTERVEGWSLVELLALCHRAAGYLGNDSGVSHLAGVGGVRGVTVFGATPARRWRPHHGRLATVESSAPCENGIALEAVSSDAVWDALRAAGCLDKLLGRK